MSDEIVCPSSPKQRKEAGFSDSWNFHHTIESIDGKHVAIQQPPNCGFYCYNYSDCHSIALLALVDSNDKFMYNDIGAEESCSGTGIFEVKYLRHALKSNAAGLPERETIYQFPTLLWEKILSL